MIQFFGFIFFCAVAYVIYRIFIYPNTEKGKREIAEWEEKERIRWKGLEDKYGSAMVSLARKKQIDINMPEELVIEAIGKPVDKGNSVTTVAGKTEEWYYDLIEVEEIFDENGKPVPQPKIPPQYKRTITMHDGKVSRIEIP